MDETSVQQNKTSVDQSESIVAQPTANGILPHHDTDQAAPPGLDGSEDCNISSGCSATDSLSSSDNTQLLLGSSPSSQPQTENSSSSSLQDRHQKVNQRNTSPAPNMTDAHIKQAAEGDCCVHCLLACLFCELSSLCSALVQCLLCGGGAACAEMGGACCCSDALIGCCCLDAGCTDECGVIETCCGSADCLEICLECCSICFPT
ncbi:myoD family inhibitor isoform X2 [Boleophthalmus pectinirostris]|uniref:myoD family inhibitor isoform X2 n=1 Tax=Boleophthalmus pectinirostris TaxID=150288 RepID=UPI002430F588|nr:myoD family inhibitor isoform X2 [Boleophthalmus pectinirostris]